MGEDWIPYAKRDKLSFPLMLGIAASSICPSMIWSAIMGLYFGLAFKLGITGTLNTVVLLLGSLIGFIVTPIVGVISDGTTLKWGRRRIYMVVGSLILLIAYILVIFCDKIVKSPSGVKGLFIFGILLAYTGTNILQGPARYLISDVCPPTQQVLMGSIGAIYTGIGGLFNNLIGALALYKYTSLTQEQFILVCSIVVITVSTLISCIVAKEEQLTEKPETSNPFAGIVVAFKDMTKPRLILCMVSFVMNIAGYTYALQLNTSSRV